MTLEQSVLPVTGEYSDHWMEAAILLILEKDLVVHLQDTVRTCNPFGGYLDGFSVPFCSQLNIEALWENLYFESKENLAAALEVILERVEDFTDSAYTSHEHRERILELSTQARTELQQFISVWMQAVRTVFIRVNLRQ